MFRNVVNGFAFECDLKTIQSLSTRNLNACACLSHFPMSLPTSVISSNPIHSSSYLNQFKICFALSSHVLIVACFKCEKRAYTHNVFKVPNITEANVNLDVYSMMRASNFNAKRWARTIKYHYIWIDLIQFLATRVVLLVVEKWKCAIHNIRLFIHWLNTIIIGFGYHITSTITCMVLWNASLWHYFLFW